jgi:hypothetical protein
LPKNWMKPDFFANWEVVVALDQVIHRAFEAASQAK